MTAEDIVLLGIVGAPHGIAGEVRIKSFTADPLAIAEYGPLSDGAGRTFEIAALRPAKEVVIARLKGVSRREQAEALNGVKLYVPRARLPAPDDEDDFLQADLIGCAAIDASGVTLGRVEAVANFGAGDLLDLRLEDGRSVYLPFLKAYVPTVDVAGRRLVVTPPEGLFDPDEPAP